jgi:hypothetical protein
MFSLANYYLSERQQWRLLGSRLSPPPADGIYRIHYSYEENMQPPTMGTGIAAAGDFCVLLLVDYYKLWVAMPTRWVRVGNQTDVNHHYYGYLKMVLTSEGPQWRLEEDIVPYVRLVSTVVWWDSLSSFTLT